MSESEVQLETLKVEWTKCRAYEEKKQTLLTVSCVQVDVKAHMLIQHPGFVRIHRVSFWETKRG